MHDEVSETENIRKNLAIERIIIGGCDILLDVNQVFVRQGSVLQAIGNDKSRVQRSRIGSLRGEKEVVSTFKCETSKILIFFGICRYDNAIFSQITCCYAQEHQRENCIWSK